jgi:hypothetical protein
MNEYRCLFCGWNADEPDHLKTCDGRQGGRDDEVTPPPVLDLQQARDARNEGIARVEDHATDLFMVAAGQAIYELARIRLCFVIDDVWAIRSNWPQTHDKRAMGAAMLQAKRDRIIAPTEDFRPSAQRQCHANPRRVWRSLIHAT